MLNETVEILNKNSGLPLKILMPYSKFKKDIKFQNDSFEKYIEDYMSFDYYYKDYFVSLKGYPNDECDFYLTYMKLNFYNYHIFL